MLGRNKQAQYTPAEGIAAARNQAAATRAPAGVDLPGPAPNTAGPHRQDLLNKIDPTVDSMDGGTQVLGSGVNSRNQTGMATHTGHNTTVPGGQHRSTAPVSAEAAGFGATGTSSHRETTAQSGMSGGQVHNSRMANELDPRINTSAGGVAIPKNGAGYEQNQQAHYGPTGGVYTHEHSTMPGGGNSHALGRDPRLANEPGSHTYATGGSAAVPRTDIHTTSGVRTTAVHVGPEVHPGPASKTAGPHSSNILNKLDPRVDSRATVIDRKEYRTS